MKFAQGTDGMLFTPWANNVSRDIHAACERTGIDHCSPNDLRRTFGTWMRADCVQPHLIGAMMGHTDSRMVERVYGRLPIGDFHAAVAASLGVQISTVKQNPKSQPDCIAGVTDSADSPGFIGPNGLGLDAETAETLGRVVLGPGIEPGTRGFSIRCSTS
jgi:hypothetical protein